MAERWCAVTVMDPQGKKQTIEVQARSRNHAALLFNERALGKFPGEPLPKPTEETIYEVRPIGEKDAYRVSDRQLSAWVKRQQAEELQKAVFERRERRRERR